MIRLMALVLVFSMGFLNSAVADEQAKKQELCGLLAQLAEVTMSARQSGAAMQTLIELANSQEKDLRPTMEAIVVDAFTVPRYQTEAARTREVEDFRDKVYMACHLST